MCELVIFVSWIEIPDRIELYFSYTAPASFRNLIKGNEDLEDTELGPINLYSRYVLFNGDVPPRTLT